MALKSLTAAPIQKVACGSVGGAFSIVVLYLLNTYAGFNPPAAVSEAIATLFSFVFSYLVPPGANDAPVQATPSIPRGASPANS